MYCIKWIHILKFRFRYIEPHRVRTVGVPAFCFVCIFSNLSSSALAFIFSIANELHFPISAAPDIVFDYDSVSGYRKGYVIYIVHENCAHGVAIEIT